MAYSEGGGLTASDVALLTGNGNNGGFGGNGDNAWWIILFLIFGLGNGFGGRGFGGYGGGGSGAADNYVLATDFATIERKLDSVNAGICDSTFALNNTMTNGFANVQQTLCQGFSGVNQAISNSAFNTERGLWNVSSQIADCCCTTQRSIDQVNYNTAMNTNAIQQTLCGNTRDIIEATNANFRALHDEIVANRMEDKNAQIQAQQNEINALRLAASQEKQNRYLVSELRPCPIPAYITCNPYQSYNYNPCGCGC
jgi:hypothetical protein